MIAGFLRGAADFWDAVQAARAEQRTGFSEREAGDYLDTAGATTAEFMDLDEFLGTASDDELAAMADQHVVDTEVHCAGCKCPTICGCGREIYAEYDRPGSPPLWFHCDDDSPITLECARIRDGLQAAPDDLITHVDDPICKARQPGECYLCTLPVGHSGNHIAHVVGDVVASQWAEVEVSHEDLAACVAGSIRHFRVYRTGNFEDAANDIASDLISEYRVTKK